jgi:hypothetical protein
MPQSDYTVSIHIKADEKVSGPAKGAAKSLQALAKAAKDTRLAESLGKPSDLAHAALAKLDKALLSGELKLETYEDAVRGVQKSFGLVTPESQKAADTLQKLDRQLAKGEISADEYERELRQVAKALDTVDDESKAAGKSTDLMAGIMQGVGQAVGGFAINAARQIPQVAAELFNLGVAAQSTENRFEKFAGGPERAAMFLEAFNEGADRTVDKMTAMTSAGRLLQMGLVENAGEMESIAAMATKLGDQTEDASARISGFAAMLANQSIPRLDNYGISSGRVRQRIDELIKSGQALDRETAFKMAVMEEGEKSLKRLGDTSQTVASQMDVLKAAWTDAKMSAGELMIQSIGAAEGVEELAAVIRGTPAFVSRLNETVKLLNITGVTSIKSFGDMGRELRALWRDTEKTAGSAEVLRYQYTLLGPAVQAEKQSFTELSFVSDEVKKSLNDQVVSQGMLEHTILNTIAAIDAESKSITKAAERAVPEANLGAIISFTSQFEQREEQAKEAAKRREAAEIEHQEKLAKLQARGQSRAIQIDVQAEQKKLEKLQERLDVALQRQSEFNDKTAQSTQMAKANQIETLQGEIAEQQGLLEAFHAGRLIRAGENVNALIAEEDRRHQAALAGLGEEEAKQAEIQEKATGRMLLQTFDQWASQKKISAKKAGEMRTAIAKEYGLISEEAATAANIAIREWETWASGMGGSTDQVVNFLGDLTSAGGEVFTQLGKLTSREWAFRVHLQVTTGSSDDTIPQSARSPAGISGVSRVPSSINNNRTINVFDARAASIIAMRDRRRRSEAPLHLMG